MMSMMDKGTRISTEQHMFCDRARKPFHPHRLWVFVNKLFHVQQPKMHDHEDEDNEEVKASEAGTKRQSTNAETVEKANCSEVQAYKCRAIHVPIKFHCPQKLSQDFSRRSAI